MEFVQTCNIISTLLLQFYQHGHRIAVMETIECEKVLLNLLCEEVNNNDLTMAILNDDL